MKIKKKSFWNVTEAYFDLYQSQHVSRGPNGSDKLSNSVFNSVDSELSPSTEDYYAAVRLPRSSEFLLASLLLLYRYSSKLQEYGHTVLGLELIIEQTIRQRTLDGVNTITTCLDGFSGGEVFFFFL